MTLERIKYRELTGEAAGDLRLPEGGVATSRLRVKLHQAGSRLARGRRPRRRTGLSPGCCNGWPTPAWSAARRSASTRRRSRRTRALRSIVRRDSGKGYDAFLRGLAAASGHPDADVPSWPAWTASARRTGPMTTGPIRTQDPDAKITKMKDGRTHLASQGRPRRGPGDQRGRRRHRAGRRRRRHGDDGRDVDHRRPSRSKQCSRPAGVCSRPRQNAEFWTAVGRCQRSFNFPQVWSSKIPPPLVESNNDNYACGRSWAGRLRPVQVAVGARQRVHGDLDRRPRAWRRSHSHRCRLDHPGLELVLQPV